MSLLDIPRPSQLSVSPRLSSRKIRQSLGTSPISAFMSDRHKALVHEFEQIDKNQDHQLTYTEVHDFLSNKQGSIYDHNLCHDLFNKMDKDGDGVVTVDEFIWSYVESEEQMQNRIKDIKKSIFDSSKKMDEFKKKLIQTKTSESFNAFGIMHGSKLTVEVLDAKDLVPMDSNGLSDPYVILEVAGQKEQTKYIRETLNPVWNEEFAFSIENGKEELKIVVMDKDVLPPDDFEGQVTISLAGYKDQMKHETYFPLLDQNNCPGSFGKIRLGIHWVWSKVKYLEDVLKQWEQALESDKKELFSLDEELGKLKRPFGYLDRQSDWIIREDRSLSTRGTGDFGFIHNIEATEKRFSFFIQNKFVGAPAVLLYILLSVVVMFARPDFFNVTVSLCAGAMFFNKNSEEKARTVAYLVGSTQIYDFFWLCVYSGEWNRHENFHFLALWASYLNFIVKFAVFLTLWKRS